GQPRVRAQGDEHASAGDGIDSDVLYPEAEAKALVERLPNAQYSRIQSPHGHDAFLIEFPQVAAQLRRFLTQD
ncbi:MAG TPA: hypothetical protein VFN03_09250, partial [Trueperaceae bacterium]|nr:hypothetical protein [Trueperaceae bacterium]